MMSRSGVTSRSMRRSSESSARAARSLGEHVVRRGVEHVVAGEAGAVADGLRDVALADTGLADQQHVVVAGDEVGGREVDDLVFGDLRVEAEVEVLEGLATLEVCAAQARGRLLAVTAFDLVVEEPVEEFLEGQAVVDGLAATQIEGLEHARQAQFFEDGIRSSVGCIGVFQRSCEQFLDVAGESWSLQPSAFRQDHVGQPMFVEVTAQVAAVLGPEAGVLELIVGRAWVRGRIDTVISSPMRTKAPRPSRCTLAAAPRYRPMAAAM